MSTCRNAARPFARCLQQSQPATQYGRLARGFSTSQTCRNEAAVAEASTSGNIDPLTVVSPAQEKVLASQGVKPVGSRRRRAALKSSDNIPFEQLPYQAFQEARKILQADREEKLRQIEKERARIAKLGAQDASRFEGGEVQKQRKLLSMQNYLERLKILADINDPLIKKRFEDGEGDMNKPIYRYLADRKWRSYQRLITVQRLTQLNIVPDLLPHFEPTADVRMNFRGRNVQPGDYVDSRVSEVPPTLKVQVFDKGERLVTVVVVDSDVPVIEEDNFIHRCHYIAANIPISPTQTSVPLGKVKGEQLVLPYLPAFAQKGSPYHRYSVFVLEQQPGQTIDTTALKETKRDSFLLRSFVDKHGLKPVGLSIFRSTWDEGTAGVMQRAGVEGWDVEFKRKRIPALKPKQKPRGWEARHASTKYRALWR